MMDVQDVGHILKEFCCEKASVFGGELLWCALFEDPLVYEVFSYFGC